MIFYFKIQLGYKRKNIFIILKNLASVLKNPHKIDKKLAINLALNWIARVLQPILLFISLLLRIISNFYDDLYYIYYIFFSFIKINYKYSKKYQQIIIIANNFNNTYSKQ